MLKRLDDGPQDGIGLNELDLRGEELVGVVVGHLRGLFAEHAGGHAAVDVDGDRGFVDRREAQRDDECRDDNQHDEGEHLPALAAAESTR